jgi:U4/U6 small nuclear ribonucleoprotein PRP3
MGLLQSLPQTKKNKAPEPAQQGAGLKMAAHPLLLDTTPAAPQGKKDKYKPMQPKFASIKANVRNAPTPPPPVPTPTPQATTSNPYTSAIQDSAPDFESGAAPKDRKGRQFRFNPKGKYVAMANQVRQEEAMEALKKRIAESARKAGMGGEFEGLEKNLKVCAALSLVPHWLTISTAGTSSRCRVVGCRVTP